MLLEDEFGDIIKKAQAGLNFSSQELARVSTISIKEIEQLKLYKQPTQAQINSLAEYLRLDSKKLSNIAFRKWHPIQKEHKDIIRIQQDFQGSKTNNYLIINNNGCIIIDSTGSEAIFNEIRKRALKPSAVLITHLHNDNTAELDKIQSRYRCKIYQEQEDSEIEIGKFKITVMKTPGHTLNHNCYLYKNYCFTGDLL